MKIAKTEPIRFVPMYYVIIANYANQILMKKNNEMRLLENVKISKYSLQIILHQIFLCKTLI